MEWTEIKALAESFFKFELFSLKDSPVTVSSIFIFILLLFVFHFLSRMAQRLLRNHILNRIDMDMATQYTMLRVMHYLTMVIGLLIAFQVVGIDLSGLAVIFGFLSVGIGFGLQNITSNFMSGLILLMEKPIKVGDRVTVTDYLGDVLEINIRSTTIRTLQNVHVIVPNSEFVSSHVINWSHGDVKVRLDLVLPVAYGSDLEIIQAIFDRVAGKHPDILTHPEPLLHFEEFADSYWKLVAKVWLPNPKWKERVQSEFYMGIIKEFHNAGVVIPFPQRDVYLKQPETTIPPEFSGRTDN